MTITGVALATDKNEIIISLPKPCRHGHLFLAFTEVNKELSPEDRFNTLYLRKLQQGFITNEGKFLNRLEAKKHAVEVGQFNIYDGENNENGYDNNPFLFLFSEDLW